MKKRGLFSRYPNLVLLCLICNLAWVRSVAESFGGPIRLLPENPRYFEWQGRPTILVASGEYYGSVVNADFDYLRCDRNQRWHAAGNHRIAQPRKIQNGRRAPSAKTPC